MARLSFDLDWMESENVNGPELAATWASLRIRAGSATVTLALDERASTVRERIFVSLYPLAEWLATNWWALTSVMESPIKHDSAGFGNAIRWRPIGRATPTQISMFSRSAA